MELLDFAQTFVTEEYQIIILAPNQEKLGACHEYFKNIKV